MPPEGKTMDIILEKEVIDDLLSKKLNEHTIRKQLSDYVLVQHQLQSKKGGQIEPPVSTKTADIENDCWHCKEFEQHINQRTGYCHKNKFSANVRIAKTIKCENFEHH